MSQLPILMYHWFRGAGLASASQSPQLEISPELFREQLGFLARKGYRTVGLAAALRMTRAELPRRPLIITFDDGTLDFWDHARPALEEHGFTATQFVVTDYIGRTSSWDEALGEPARPLMDWHHLVELQRAGFEIASHSHRHRVFTELSDDDVREELVSSRDLLTEHLGRAPELFAYPRGFFTERHKQLVLEAGYQAGCAVILSWRDMLSADRLALRRMTIKGSESMSRFRLRLALSKWIPYSEAGPCSTG